jgi:hypothetical protein
LDDPHTRSRAVENAGGDLAVNGGGPVAELRRAYSQVIIAVLAEAESRL